VRAATRRATSTASKSTGPTSTGRPCARLTFASSESERNLLQAASRVVSSSSRIRRASARARGCATATSAVVPIAGNDSEARVTSLPRPRPVVPRSAREAQRREPEAPYPERTTRGAWAQAGRRARAPGQSSSARLHGPSAPLPFARRRHRRRRLRARQPPRRSRPGRGRSPAGRGDGPHRARLRPAAGPGSDRARATGNQTCMRGG
jgi:hypothetical protein